MQGGFLFLFFFTIIMYVKKKKKIRILFPADIGLSVNLCRKNTNLSIQTGAQVDVFVIFFFFFVVSPF